MTVCQNTITLYSPINGNVMGDGSCGIMWNGSKILCNDCYKAAMDACPIIAASSADDEENGIASIEVEFPIGEFPYDDAAFERRYPPSYDVESF